MNRTRRVAIGTTAVLTSIGLVLAGASTAQAHDRGNGPLSTLVANGTVTSAQLSAVKDALKAAHESDRADHLAERKAARDAALASLVTAGTLTSAQASSIAAADRGGLRDLIDEGTVTREQLRAVHDALRTERASSRTEHRAEKAAELSAVLATLVSKGTLSQAQADAVKAAIAERPERGKHRGHGLLGGRS